MPAPAPPLPPQADQSHLPFCQVMAGLGAPDVSQASTTDMPSITVLSRGPLVMLGAMPVKGDSGAAQLQLGGPPLVWASLSPVEEGCRGLTGWQQREGARRTLEGSPCHPPHGRTQVTPVPTLPCFSRLPLGETGDSQEQFTPPRPGKWIHHHQT